MDKDVNWEASLNGIFKEVNGSTENGNNEDVEEKEQEDNEDLYGNLDDEDAGIIIFHLYFHLHHLTTFRKSTCSFDYILDFRSKFLVNRLDVVNVVYHVIIVSSGHG